MFGDSFPDHALQGFELMLTDRILSLATQQGFK
jgi:hypothetical protein